MEPKFAVKLVRSLHSDKLQVEMMDDMDLREIELDNADACLHIHLTRQSVMS